MTKTMSIRIPEKTAQTLAAVSRAESRSINQIVVEALEMAIERRQADAAFQTRLRAMIAEDAEILEALAK
jgi:predicted transcriptional regulator